MTYLLEGRDHAWELVIGLEVHAQVQSASKLFSGAPAAFGAEPNANVSLVDAAMPGMLPVLNEHCVFQAVRTGAALNAKINRYSVFDRKNYFYADLPQGYQISQFEFPIVGEGELEAETDEGERFTARIERIHLEQDAGKSLHDRLPEETLIDLNRSGVALMEIVTKPDMRSPAQAAAFMRELRAILRYIGSSDGDMEKGNMRCDANISVRPEGSSELRTRCEIKNLNSMRFLQQAIVYEATRHIEIYESGGTVDQETRLFNADQGITRTMRSKEEAHDYRYFPDPDLLPLELPEDYEEKARATLPELPAARRARYVSQYGISPADAVTLTAEKSNAEFFDGLAAKHSPKLAAGWVASELFGRLNKRGITLEESPVTSERFSGLLALIEDGTVSGKIAKDVLDDMFDSGESADAIVERKGLKQVSDTGAIEKIIDDVLADNAAKVEEYKSGKDKLFGFFVGQVMKMSQGKANPGLVNKILKEKLNA